MSRLLISFILVLSIFSFANANSRGIKKIYSDSGQEITSYEGSYALLIGVSNYTNGWPSLDAIPQEMDKIRSALIEKGFNVEMVIDPKSRDLENAYEDFIYKYGYHKKNRLLFFYSGHGYSTNNGTKGYLVPTDAPNPNKNLRDFKRKSLKMSRLLSLSREMEANHAIFMFDSCFSGSIFKTRALPKKPPYIKNSIAKPVRQFITAGSAGEEVPAKSVFAPLFIDAIEGEADLNRDGYVTGSELGMHLANSVPKFKQQNPQYGKIQDYELSRGDFIFVSPNSVQQKEKAKKSKNYSFTTLNPGTFSLTIIPTPSDASVFITNIGPRYQPGMRLKNGLYNVTVQRAGYLTKKGQVNLSGDLKLEIVLEKDTNTYAPAVKSSPAFSSVVAPTPQVESPDIVEEDTAPTVEPVSLLGSAWMDQSTGLVWQTAIHTKVYTWSDSKLFCEGLTFGGFDNWRLPNKRELMSTLSRRAIKNVNSSTKRTYIKKPLINTMHMKWQLFWNSEERDETASYIYFGDGKEYYDDKESENYVRCVRDNTQ